MIGIVILGVVTFSAIFAGLVWMVAEGVEYLPDNWEGPISAFLLMVGIAALIGTAIGFIAWGIHWSEVRKMAEAFHP